MILHTELNNREVDYNSDIKVMGIKILKDLLKKRMRVKIKKNIRLIITHSIPKLITTFG